MDLIYVKLVWVIYHGLTLELWNHNILEGVGNTIAMFVSLNKSMIRDETRVIKILVELDLREWIPMYN